MKQAVCIILCTFFWMYIQQYSKLPRCVKAIQENCIDLFDDMNCNAATNFCDAELSVAYRASGK